MCLAKLALLFVLHMIHLHVQVPNDVFLVHLLLSRFLVILFLKGQYQSCVYVYYLFIRYTASVPTPMRTPCVREDPKIEITYQHLALGHLQLE